MNTPKCDPELANLLPKLSIQRVLKRLRSSMPVHQFGLKRQPLAISNIRSLAKEPRLRLQHSAPFAPLRFRTSRICGSRRIHASARSKFRILARSSQSPGCDNPGVARLAANVHTWIKTAAQRTRRRQRAARLRIESRGGEHRVAEGNRKGIAHGQPSSRCEHSVTELPLLMSSSN